MEQISNETFQIESNGDKALVSLVTSTGQESSVEIATGAKGEIKLVVKAYHADINQAAKQVWVTFCEMSEKIEQRKEQCKEQCDV